MAASLAICTVFLMVAVTVHGGWNETHICCDGENVIERDEDSQEYCCGQTLYDSSKNDEVCCDGNIVPYVYNESIGYGCCYIEHEASSTLSRKVVPYDLSKELCCSSGVVPLPEGHKGDSSYSYGCCGNTAYNYTESVCCGEKISPRSENLGCCGGISPYDLNTCLCTYNYNAENGTSTYELMEVPNNHTDLCNKTLYDTEKYACCMDEIIPKDESLKYMKYPSFCYSESGPKPYNYSAHVCCPSGELLDIPENSGSGIYECCNLQILNYSHQVCCNDVIYDRLERYQGFCCGSEMVYNETTEYCCNNTVFKKKENENVGCCDDETINYDTEICCNGVQTVDNSSLFSCCDGKIMNSNTDVCCDGIQTVGDSSHFECCYYNMNQTVYDTRVLKCEFNGLSEIPSDEVAYRTKMGESRDFICTY